MHREATAADLPKLRAIQQTSLDEPWEDLLAPAVDGPPLVLVSTTETDEPVGYAVVLPEQSAGYLAEFAIEPPHRRQGRGSALMRALFDRLASQGKDRLRLTVRVDDDRARAFYDDHDFTAYSLLPEEYEDGDALVLGREL